MIEGPTDVSAGADDFERNAAANGTALVGAVAMAAARTGTAVEGAVPSVPARTGASGSGAALALAASAALEASVCRAVSAVCDPEYPDITIADLGILERVSLRDDGEAVRIELVPTMLGCPALDVIARDVTAAARSACAGSDVSVEVAFLADPVWTPDRIAPSAVEFMAREYAVAVRPARADVSRAALSCPICGGTALEHRSDFGPTPCRSVSWCPSCRNPIEIVGRVDVQLTAPMRRLSGTGGAPVADSVSAGAVAVTTAGAPVAHRVAVGAVGASATDGHSGGAAALASASPAHAGATA